MKKNVIVCGIISGVIVSALMAIMVATMYENPNFEGNMFLGYASMILAFSLIYVAVKNYRDKYNNGIIKFGKAFLIGLYVSLIASTFYVVTWLIAYYNFVPDFMDKYSEHVIQSAQKSGATQIEIEKQTAEMASMKEMYKNPLFVILMTYMEILPVGLLVSLLVAAILKRRSKPEELTTAHG